MSEVHSFLWLNNTPLYGINRLCLFIRQSLGTGVVYAFWFLGIRLLWTFMYNFLRGDTLSVPLGIGPGVERLGHVITVFNILGNC